MCVCWVKLKGQIVCFHSFIPAYRFFLCVCNAVVLRCFNCIESQPMSSNTQMIKLIYSPSRENVFPSTSDKPESRSVMPAGSCTAWNTESSLMVRCHQTRQLEAVMTPSTPSSARLVLANTSQEPSSLTWNQL